MGKNCVYKCQKMILFYTGNSYILRPKLPKTPIFLAKIILYSSYIFGKTWLTAWVLQKYKVGDDLGNPYLHVTWYLENQKLGIPYYNVYFKRRYTPMAEKRMVCFLSKTVNICRFQAIFWFKSTIIIMYNLWRNSLAYLQNSWFSSKIWRTVPLRSMKHMFYLPVCQILLCKGFRNTNNLITDMFLKL